MSRNTNITILALAALAAGAGTLYGRRAATDVRPDGTIRVATQNETVEVLPLTDGIFRVRHIPHGPTEFLPSQSVILPEDPEGNILVTVAPGLINGTTPKGRVEINSKTGLITFLAPDGSTLLQEAASSGNSLPGLKTLAFLNSGPQNFYGAGERGHSLRLNGDSLSMYNRQNYGYTASDPRISQMGISVPYIASDKGYAILFDDFAKASLRLGSDSIIYESETPYGLSYYLLTNGTDSNLRDLTGLYTSLTGHQPLPPLWTLGYITSKYGYKNRAEAEEVVERLKKNGYPLDGMVLDLYWYGVEQDMGRLEWNPDKWPGHADMLRNLADRGVNTVLISQPYINKGGAIDNYNMLSAEGMLVKDAKGDTHDVTTWVGDAGMFDVSNPDTRRWLWNRLKNLTAEGVAGWWGDLGEPEVHPSTIRHANGMTAEQYHNAYGNEWSRLIYEGLRKDFPSKRPLLMMRGGTAGLQRYGVFPWTTDVSRSWGGLKPQINLMLSSGLSGLGYMGSDIGGFAVDPDHPTDPELYVRWLQTGVFTPMLRTHAQEQPEPFNYPGVEPILKRYIKMRYEWLPYNYTLAYENASTGAPLARPLNFYGDPSGKYADVQDEYLWGRDILVAPVTDKGARSRKVLFPQGEWVDWNSPDLRFKGGTTATVKAPLDRLPLFVRAGAIIPQFLLPVENTLGYTTRTLTLKYFRGSEESHAVVFDDDHISPTSLEDGSYQLMEITADPSADGGIDFNFASSGNYEGAPSTRQITLEITDTKKAPAGITLGGRPVRVVKHMDGSVQEGWHFDASSRLLSIRFIWDMESLGVHVAPAVSR